MRILYSNMIFSDGGFYMSQDYRAHPPQFRQREFWLDHESPGTRNKFTILLCILMFLVVALIFLMVTQRDNTEYATLDHVKKIEAHMFQLEERLVWTDEKIDTMQAATEAAPFGPIIKEPEVKDEGEVEPEPIKSDFSDELSGEVIESSKKQEPPEIEIKVVQPAPKEIPVIHPKIKKKKIKRRDYGVIYKYHKVRQGETLYRIGLKYDVPVSEIRRLNHLDPNESIHPGQRLLVSQGER
ncbi:Peptidoglycan-binding Lysin subgroup domain protein [Candidatus Magnetomorum sp. HK-1]|nr:Peptidoglycan-binding Lysin subgroup domain protein [Candidatus Magnetomorum sp. HK-1]